MESRPSISHIGTIDGLRAIAAMAVCWYHVTRYFRSDTALSILTATGHDGFMGVQVFFVISGFVIPYALHRSGYRVSMVGAFVAKRIARIDPPYLATVAIVLVYKWIASYSPQHHNSAYVIHWGQVFAHLGYLNAFIGRPWLLDSFWTLAIEFQYYLAMGLLFPVIARRGLATTLGVALVCGTASWLLPWNAHLPHHLPFFAMGIAVFRRLALDASWMETAFLVCASLAVSGNMFGWVTGFVGLATALLILFVRYSNTLLDFFGEISYSLYLIHPLVASIVILEGGRRFGGSSLVRTLLLLGTVAASTLVAWVLNRYVEVPSKRWAASIPYRRTKQVAVAELALADR